MKKKIIIDTDPAMGTKGGDPEDCFAIMLAMNSPELEILGITTVQGNVPVERGFSNATYLVEQLGKDIPVHAGKPGTYSQDRNEKRKWLGQRGEMEQLTPILSIENDKKGAPAFIAETAKENSGDIELVTIGPLTNIAQALDLDPELPNHINKVTMMAGASTVQGNVTPAAEFNVWADPESAARVFGSGIPIRMVPLDVCHKTRFGREQLNLIGENEHPFCQFVQKSVDPWLKINPNKEIIDLAIKEIEEDLLNQIKFFEWISNYYMCPIGKVYETALPKLLLIKSESIIEVINEGTEDNLSEEASNLFSSIS